MYFPQMTSDLKLCECVSCDLSVNNMYRVTCSGVRVLRRELSV